jgi:PKD repeat protein
VKTINLNVLILAGVAILSVAGCKKAEYGILKPGKAPELATGVTGQNSTFKFEATPGTTFPEAAVAFSGACISSQKHEITWDFGDKSAPATGEQVSHAYKEIGAYPVIAVCTLANGHKLSATVTITVIIKNVGTGSGNPNQTPAQGPVQSTPDQANPSQSNPDQSSPGQSSPGQSSPGQSSPGQSTPDQR